jgi:F0F1-type ATP synthase delta subunit
MLKNQIAKPYAAALLEIGRSTNTLEFITDDIKNLLENIFENEELIEYFKNPTYSKKAKTTLLNKVVVGDPPIVCGEAEPNVVVPAV